MMTLQFSPLPALSSPFKAERCGKAPVRTAIVALQRRRLGGPQNIAGNNSRAQSWGAMLPPSSSSVAILGHSPPLTPPRSVTAYCIKSSPLGSRRDLEPNTPLCILERGGDGVGEAVVGLQRSDSNGAQ